MKQTLRGAAVLLGAGLLAAAAAPPSWGEDPDDPWEPFNRKIFAFNDFLSRHALEPVGRGWAWLVPKFVRDSIARVYENARTPVVMVNDLLQGKPREAGVDLARLILNSSVGLAGLMDPAAAIGLEANQEDFGQTFGVWGIPPGPYLVLPLFGPSSPRDAVGRAADGAAVPVGFFVPLWVTASIATLDLTNSYSFSWQDIQTERSEAFDWYAAVRNAHVSRRDDLVHDRAASPDEEKLEEDEEDLYHPERLEEAEQEESPRGEDEPGLDPPQDSPKE
jgi:phospholipid-binding lipoprotein MlaA